MVHGPAGQPPATTRFAMDTSGHRAVVAQARSYAVLLAARDNVSWSIDRARTDSWLSWLAASGPPQRAVRVAIAVDGTTGRHRRLLIDDPDPTRRWRDLQVAGVSLGVLVLIGLLAASRA